MLWLRLLPPLAWTVLIAWFSTDAWSAAGTAPPLLAVLHWVLPGASPEQLDVLQLVHNYGSLKGVLDHTDKNDVQAAEVVLSLIQKDYVRPG